MHTPPTQPAAVSPTEAAADEQHLKLLTLFYYIMSGLSALGVCAGGIYVFMGWFMAEGMRRSSKTSPNAPSPEFFQWLFTGLGAGVIVMSLVLGLLYFLDARWISQRRHRMFTYVLAGFSCLSIPVGTALGVYTFMVMRRPGVRAQYDRNASRP